MSIVLPCGYGMVWYGYGYGMVWYGGYGMVVDLRMVGKLLFRVALAENSTFLVPEYIF